LAAPKGQVDLPIIRLVSSLVALPVNIFVAAGIYGLMLKTTYVKGLLVELASLLIAFMIVLVLGLLALGFFLLARLAG
jgi:hypothetical protein